MANPTGRHFALHDSLTRLPIDSLAPSAALWRWVLELCLQLPWGRGSASFILKPPKHLLCAGRCLGPGLQGWRGDLSAGTQEEDSRV